MVVVGECTESDSESYTAPPFSPLGSEHNLEWSDGGSENEGSSSEEQGEKQGANFPGARADDDVEEHNEDQESMTQEFPIATTSEAPQDEPLSIRSSWFGFKLVGDNVDKGTKASFQRAETHENAPFHYFHSYAVKDRLDLSQCSDEPPTVPEVIKAESILPTWSEFDSIKEDFTILLSR